MAFKDEALEILKRNNSKHVCSSSVGVYWNGRIPQKILNGAKSTYVGNVRDDDILLIMDTTLFNSGKGGITFTVNGIYIKELLTSPIYASYENNPKLNSCEETYFHLGNLNATLQELNKAWKKHNGFMAQAAKFAAGDEADDDLFGNVIKGLDRFSKWLDKQAQPAKVELYTKYRDEIKGISSLLNEKINCRLEDDNTENILEEIYSIYLVALAAVDLDKFAEISETPKEEHFNFPAAIDQIDQAVVGEKDKYGLSPLNLKSSSQAYYQKMTNILSEIDDIDDNEELVELWERSVNAASSYRKKLKEAIKDLNILMEGMMEKKSDIR